MASREQQVLALIREDPMTPQQAIASRLGITRSAVAGHIMNLTQKGLIKGRGYVLSDTPFVAIVGGANVDIHGRSTHKLRSHDSNPGQVHISPGGVARNVAENLARLGIESRLVSAVGTDQHGQMLTRMSRDAGIDVQYLHTIPGAQTSSYISVLDDDGDMLLAINDMSIIDELSVDLLRAQTAMLRRAALIVVDCNLTADTLAWLFESFGNVPIFADTVSTAKAPRLRDHLDRIHTLKTSSIEIEALLGGKAQTEAQLKKLTKVLHARGTKRVFITRGAKGTYYSDGQHAGALGPHHKKRKIQNAGGAGDAFLAGLAYSHVEEWDLLKSVSFALAAAELTLEHVGTNHPSMSLANVQEIMEQQSA
ncbi:MAG: PfkB family carbohydrate kinase [Woeseiaceae bacterium]